MDDLDELGLLRRAFGEDWKRAVIQRVNVYDLSRNWPAYQRPDNLGIFAAAVLEGQLPIVGHGKTARPMRLGLDKVYAQERMLNPTLGIAHYLNDVLQNAGLLPQAFERKQVVEVFLNFSPHFQQDLLVSILFDSMEDFYTDLSRQWEDWSGGDMSASGKISPIDIWAYYAKFELRPIREELENVVAMHTEEAANVIMDLQSTNLGRKCDVCAKRAAFICTGCTRTAYCSVGCQRKNWTTHATRCTK